MDKTEPVLQVANLSKTYGGWFRRSVTALEGISFSVMPGEVFGLLGPNGSGKSTTIKLTLGLLRPTGGSVTIYGGSPASRSVRARIGYLPEENYFQSFLTGRQILNYIGKLHSIRSRDRSRRVDEMLETVGLKEAADQVIREYSRGMLRRIGIAQALIGKPGLILLDEPTSGLDPIGNREMKNLFVRLAEEGAAVLLSSHLLSDVEDVCDRIGILSRGKLKRTGGIDELLTDRSELLMKIKTLPDEKRKEIIEKVEEITGGKPALDHPHRSLEALFLETLKEEEAKDAPGAGHSSDDGS